MNKANLNDHSGNPKGSEIISTNSRIINPAAIYTARTRVTLRRFSSCQNWDSLLGIEMGLVAARYSVVAYESTIAYTDVIERGSQILI